MLAILSHPQRFNEHISFYDIFWFSISSSKMQDFSEFLSIFHWNQLPAGIILNLNTLRPEQNVRHLADNIFKCISFNSNFCSTSLECN